jgi:AcrR family transcriptional regulator/DNA-binding MarR family transcriptional regulator
VSSKRRGPVEHTDGPGRRSDLDGFEHGRVLDVQRARLLDAVGLLACEHGASRVTVAQVVSRAGVSRRTFYEIYPGIEECLLAALDEALARASARASVAWRSSGSWRERIRGCLVELLTLFEEEPTLARLLVVESLRGGHGALQRRACVLGRLIGAIDEGRRAHATEGAEATPLAAEGVLGGVLAIIHARILQEKPSNLLELASPLMGVIVLPYLGSAAARRELARPAPAPRSRRNDYLARSDPFRETGTRLSYRTMLVLCAIAELPGGSNRAIGDMAGIQDQGQASKLLARLNKRGLIENLGAKPRSGMPNAWTLTPTGWQATQHLHAHTQGTVLA